MPDVQTPQYGALYTLKMYSCSQLIFKVRILLCCSKQFLPCPGAIFVSAVNKAAPPSFGYFSFHWPCQCQSKEKIDPRFRRVGGENTNQTS